MSEVVQKTLSSEFEKIGSTLLELATSASPSVCFAAHIVALSGCASPVASSVLSRIWFPQGSFDTAPEVAVAGYFISVREPQADELSRWFSGLKRVAKRDPFPRDRQTFAFRPVELIGIALGVRKTVGLNDSSMKWLRAIVRDIPSNSPPMDSWAILLYSYAAWLLGLEFSISIPGRFSDYGTHDLALLVTLLMRAEALKASEFDPNSAQNALLEKVIVESHKVRDVEKLAALYSGIFLSLKSQFSIKQRNQLSIYPVSNAQIPHPRQKILFLAANPDKCTHLSLDEECRLITERIRAADLRDSLDLVTGWAVRPEDLMQYLNEHRPHIVHFSGHGTEADQIILLDKNRHPMPVSAGALKQLFATLKDNIRLVVLNACFSRGQARAIVDVIDCAVGMNKAIGDEAAIVFAAAFYQAIGFGRSVKTAFDSGKTMLMLSGIPEDKTPELLCKEGVDPSKIFLLHSKDGEISV